MARFHEAFLLLSEGVDLAAGTGLESELVRTAFVPVSDVRSAVDVVGDLVADGLDLLELYGGFGPAEAAPLIEAAPHTVPVGLVGVDDGPPVRDRAVIVAALGADPHVDRYVVRTPTTTFTLVGVPDLTVVPAVATTLVDRGAERIEICGGLGALLAAVALEAVGERASVGAVMFGFESLGAAAAYQSRFEAALG